MNIINFEKLDSTSTFVRQNADTLPLPSLVIADCQTAGRGRRGNSFYSPNGTGLYMTLLFEAKNELTLITPAAAVAVSKALKKFFGIETKIKWVNDIFFNDKKICGILSECIINNGRRLIAVGIGVNLTTVDFPESLPQAGSIGNDCNRNELASEISKIILDYSEKPDNESIINEYRNRLFVIGKQISFFENNICRYATVNDINEFCNLIVTTADGETKTLSSGEISIIL
ncbi:MAG: biotin--[Clostridia bacterium]|nr:biotin--[acetyl-CoA-carboxylase] ligase [Clostridia bacterium]